MADKQTFTLPTEFAPPPARGRHGGGQNSQFRELAPLIVGNARRLRREMTPAERKLWKYIQKRQIAGYKFRRQHPIEPYIADFACIEASLVIELDGGQHIERRIYDKKRDAIIQQKGYRVLRFWNNDVMQNIEGVIDTILNALDPHLTSPFQGEEERCQ